MTSSENHVEEPRKATLYCPSCTHASHINGDWIIHVHVDSLEYECPECGSMITSRGDETAVTARSDGALQFGHGD